MAAIPDPEKTIIAALAHYMPELTTQGLTRIYSQAPPRPCFKRGSLRAVGVAVIDRPSGLR